MKGDPPPAATTTGEPAATRALPVLSVESRRFHHYEIELAGEGASLRELGRGAMGVTYKARDVNLDAPVALKVVNAQLSGFAMSRERFRREARAAAQLRHPHVANVFHFGETPAGRCFYAMEFIEGETLEARVRRRGPLPAALVIEIARQVTGALIAADQRGLVHRDLKPGNLMLVNPEAGRRRPSGSAAPVFVKVIDFGLAKAAGADESELGLTQGAFVGTPEFASPEQIAGGEIDARADIFSLGVTLWFLLTGLAPFTGRSLVEIRDRQLHRPLPCSQLAEAHVPALLVALLGSMLAANPEKRPASPLALAEALESCWGEIDSRVSGSRPLHAAAPRLLALPASRWSRRRLAVIMIAALLAVGGSAFFAHHRWTTPAALDKSIAVLPLANLSTEPDSAFFADGIQDDLLASLAKIKDLRVISRSSVAQYRANLPRNLREISQQLGVTHVLEGSVRRAANRVLVNVELVDTRTHRHLWAERYDRTLADSLTLQGELATDIAVALRAELSPQEKAYVAAKPTDNPDAYQLYLRAREYEYRPSNLLGDYRTAAALYREAVTRDPGFALARARLSAALTYLYFNGEGTEETKARARAEAEEALRLQPDLGEGYFARAMCRYRLERDFDGALHELATAARLLPGSGEVEMFTAYIIRRQGRLREAVAILERVQQRDPRNAHLAGEIGSTCCSYRDWPAAAAAWDRAAKLAPDVPLNQFRHGLIDFFAHGRLAQARAGLAAIPASVDPDGYVTLARWDTALVARDYGAAEQAVKTSGSATVLSNAGLILPKPYLLGCVALARGDKAAAGALFEEARPEMEAVAQAVPGDAYRHVQLGLLFAYLGRKEEALREGRRAVELIPEARDATDGADTAGALAVILARVGEADEALALLHHLLRTPGTGMVSEFSISLADLRARWQWDVLRDDPRFKQILAGPEPETIYR